MRPLDVRIGTTWLMVMLQELRRELPKACRVDRSQAGGQQGGSHGGAVGQVEAGHVHLPKSDDWVGASYSPFRTSNTTVRSTASRSSSIGRRGTGSSKGNA